MSNTASWQFNRTLPAKGNDAKQIGNLVQRGNFASICEAESSQFFAIGAGDGVLGLTQSSVNVRCGNFIHTFGSTCSQTNLTPPRN